MAGADALLSQVCRGWIEDTGEKNNNPFSSDSLPQLAVQCGAKLPEGVTRPDPAPADPDDPLADDDPSVYWPYGILTRDASRVHAVFPDETAALRFARRARGLLSSKAEGLEAEILLQKLRCDQGQWRELGTEREAEAVRVQTPRLLPPFLLCRLTGDQPAESADPEPERRSVRVRREAGRSADRTPLGQIMRSLGVTCGWKDWPREFRDLVPGGGRRFLATVVIDGNSVGKTAEGIGTELACFFRMEAERQRFFRSMRRAVRRAFLSASQAVFGVYQKPLFRPLLLGGDDLVLVCEGSLALPFVCEFARQLSRHTLEKGDGKLRVAAGVSILKPGFPFYRAHELAERLVASAKRKSRSEPAVDWIVASESSHLDPIEARRKDGRQRYVVRGRPEVLLLSEKPYLVFSDYAPEDHDAAGQSRLPKNWSLARHDKDYSKGLMDWAIEDLARMPRTQRHEVGQALLRGPRAGAAAYREARASMEVPLTGPYRNDRPEDVPAVRHGSGIWRTPFLDAAELTELDARKKRLERLKKEKSPP